MELRCALQRYEWGKLGETSEAALLSKAANPDFQIISHKPYAELWMGTHPNGPSYLVKTGESLNEWIQKNPETLGEKVRQVFGTQLPFLFKVLSVNKALSIQAHPTKEHAEVLHHQHPQVYKDPNHKPEMALALTPFEALCGFRPLDEIKSYLKLVPELSSCIGETRIYELMHSHNETYKSALQQCFLALMSTPEYEITTALQNFLTRLATLGETERVVLQAELVERLHAQFPGDVGVFGPYLFNHLTLKPGEALYLGPNEPHAYLAGDCVECMACSDNVVRAGLTPKLKDVPTLCNMLTYICDPGEQKLFTGLQEDDNTIVFRPPVQDFAVAKITVLPGQSYQMIVRPTASIVIIIHGAAKSDNICLKRGSVLYLPANTVLSFTVNTDSEPVLMFQAMANVA